MTLVLDAGALIAVERGDRPTTLTLVRAALGMIVVPAGVVGQVWRGGPRQARLARLLAAESVLVEPLTDDGARAAGVLCGRAGTRDVVDASVVLAARRHRARVLSSDRADLEALDPDVRVLDC